MDQRAKWAKVVNDLSDQTFEKADNALYEAYREALIDIKKQANLYLKQFETLSFSQRLEAERLFDIGARIKQILDEANGKVIDVVKTSTAEQVANGYYGTFYGLEGAENINIPVSILDKSFIRSIVNKPVDGKTLSRRLYKNTERLAKTTTRSLIQGAIDGKGYAYVAKRIADQTEASYQRAIRIARTEGGRASSISTQKAYEDAEKVGVTLKKTWVATLDRKTRHSHQALDGQTVGVDENFVSPTTGAQGQGPRLMGRASEDINCRCTTIAEVNEIKPALRLDNETKRAISNMTYAEWLDQKGVE